VLKTYEENLGLPRFVYAIDWGMFWFLTRPIFWVLENVYGLVGSFGVAILALTVIVKLIMFPLANNAYASMSKMRNLQPKMEEIKARFKDDPQKQQQETMALYAEGEDQSGRRLPSASAADPGLLRPVQGADRHHRNASPAVPGLYPRPVGARSDGGSGTCSA
jgi:hypothetical protein